LTKSKLNDRKLGFNTP